MCGGVGMWTDAITFHKKEMIFSAYILQEFVMEIY